MRKSTLIATCLLNSSMASDLATAAHQVQQIFAACYPSDSFAAWNTDIPDEIILQRGRQRQTVGSVSYLPAIMGMVAASWVIRQIACR